MREAEIAGRQRAGRREERTNAMTKLRGGTQVRKGYYFEMRRWAFCAVPRDGEPLPGTSDAVYFRAPLPLVFAIAPLMGAAFLVFLPFIGFYVVAHAALRPVARLFGRSAAEMAATVRPGWRPGEAHLTGRRPESEGSEDERLAAGGELLELEREIAARRRREGGR
jgi:hypothetical protein